jgi:hypothetical protein
MHHQASGKRLVAHQSIFESQDEKDWERVYKEVFSEKYAKETRNFSRKITGKSEGKQNRSGLLEIIKMHLISNIALFVLEYLEPPIYIIPRQRGGPSYKEVKLIGASPLDLQYCLISKGYPMQDVSSFTLGPIVGEGLCVVNVAFSKCIDIMHIEGIVGKGSYGVDLKRKNFWHRSRRPRYDIKNVSMTKLKVNGKVVNKIDWLKEHEKEWLDEWRIWRDMVALCSEGSFHWSPQTVSFRHNGEYLDFVTWKKKCYIAPAYALIPKTSVFKFIKRIWEQEGIPLGLVHPKGMKMTPEEPLTRESLQELFDSEETMACMPYVFVGVLFGLPI